MSRKISQHKGLEASRLLLPEQDSADRWLTASVCFITDAGHCRENEFYTGANTPDGSSGGTPGGSSGGDGDEDNWEVDNEEKCKKEGYTNEDCGETATPGTPCLYDSSYHAGCVCKPEYNQTCTGADEAGKGASCDGKYKECCSLCSAYPYSDGMIPTGHVITETCQSCTGAKYKTKCNTNSSNTGAYISCGSLFVPMTTGHITRNAPARRTTSSMLKRKVACAKPISNTRVREQGMLVARGQAAGANTKNVSVKPAIPGVPVRAV